MSDDRELNLKQVARILDLHYMTVYRYVRSGRLRATQRSTHWVVRESDLAAMLEPASGDGSVDWVGRLAERLHAGDESGAWSTVSSALSSGWGPEAVVVDLIAAAVATTAPEDGAAAGHLAATTAQRTLAQATARFRPRGRRRGTVVLGAPDGEGHAFGLAVVADVLRLRNYGVLELGVAVPAAAFVDAVARADRPIGVGIGVTSIERLDATAEVIAALRGRWPDLPVMLGGQAVSNAEIAALSGATGWAADARGVAALVEEHAPPRRRSTEPSNRAGP